MFECWLTVCSSKLLISVRVLTSSTFRVSRIEWNNCVYLCVKKRENNCLVVNSSSTDWRNKGKVELKSPNWELRQKFQFWSTVSSFTIWTQPVANYLYEIHKQSSLLRCIFLFDTSWKWYFFLCQKKMKTGTCQNCSRAWQCARANLNQKVASCFKETVNQYCNIAELPSKEHLVWL